MTEVEDFLEHHGVKGMRWGERRAHKKAAKAELKGVKEKNARAEREASKDPSFKREVKRTLKGKGVTGEKARAEVTENYGLLTGRVLADFKNSKGERVSQDFASAVLKKSVDKQDFRKKAKIGALFVTASVLPSVIRRLS
jgi:hypothetical protein